MAMIVFGEYSIEEFMEAMVTGTGSRAYFSDGQRFRRTSQRMQLFFRDGFDCVDCGLEGNTFVLESVLPKDSPHLNLYCIDSNGKRILFTKDHILPRSRGGNDVMDNYQVMCAPCNAKKGSKTETERGKVPANV